MIRPDRIPLGVSTAFDWRGIAHRTIEIVPFLSDIDRVEAWTFGEFGVHRCLDLPGLWRITLLPIGLSLAPDWCAFDNFETAMRAAKDMQACRNEGWRAITQGDLNKPLERRLKAIAARYGAPTMRHTITPTGRAWIGGVSGLADENKFGRRISERPNGYGAAPPL